MARKMKSWGWIALVAGLYLTMMSDSAICADSNPSVEKRASTTKTTVTTNTDAPDSFRIQLKLNEMASKIHFIITDGKVVPDLPTLAVPDFSERGESIKKKNLGATVADSIISILKDKYWYPIVERQKLKELIKEIALGQTGMIDEKNAAKAGKMAGAKYFIIGSVGEMGEKISINVRVVDVETATVKGTASVFVPSADLVAISSESVVLRSKWDSTYRSAVLPGWGQFYNNQPVKGAIFSGSIVALATAAIVLHIFGMKAEDSYKSATNRADAIDYHDKAETYYTWRNISTYGMIGVWAINIIDAYVNGKTYERRSDGVVVEVK